MSSDSDRGQPERRNPSAAAGRAACAVIPAAGFATRFLPVTKSVPKELLPVVDRPVLQFIVEEAAQAGIDDVLLVTGRGKTSMVDYFDRRPELEETLANKGDQARLDAIRRPAELAQIYTVRQPEMRGLGHAVGCARAHVGGRPFAVLLGDEFFEPAALPEMLDLQARTGGIVLAFVEVPDDQVNRYGIGSVTPADPELGDPATVVRVTGLVEKPAPAQAPSNLAIAGRYVLPASIFDAIARTGPGAGGEIQLTDAMALLLAEGTPVHAVIYRGIRYDTGAPMGYLQAVVQHACQHQDIGPEFRQWLAALVAEFSELGEGGGRGEGGEHGEHGEGGEGGGPAEQPGADQVGGRTG